MKLLSSSQVSDDKPGSGVGSVREAKSFLIHPDEIKRLLRGEGIMLNKDKFCVQRVLLRQGEI
ncbi:MAG: hypothetical protein ACE365_00440 [Gammaproteobacteria bacterium]